MAFLNNTQLENYHQNGYLVVENFASDLEIKKLQQASSQIIEAFDMEQIRIFTTDDQNQHTDHYFLESGDKIRCFFEEEAFDKNGKLVTKKELAINKIGHAMHDLNPEVERFSYSQKMLSLVQDLGLNTPSIVQSQFIFKQPKIGAKVNAHTDSTFIYTQPLSCLGVWLAMEDATLENGCLCAIPGSHRFPLQDQFVRNASNSGTEFVSTNNEKVEWDLDKLIPLEVKKGDLVILHGQVVHASYANRSNRSRHSYIIHLVDLDFEWSKRNWLQRPSNMPFRNMKSVVKLLE